MDEGGVDHRVRQGRAAAQAVQVFKIAAMGLGAGGDERLGGGVRSGEAEHLVARTDQFLDDRRTDKTGGAGDEDTHGDLSLFGFSAAFAAPLSSR